MDFVLRFLLPTRNYLDFLNSDNDIVNPYYCQIKGVIFAQSKFAIIIRQRKELAKCVDFSA